MEETCLDTDCDTPNKKEKGTYLYFSDGSAGQMSFMWSGCFQAYWGLTIKDKTHLRLVTKKDTYLCMYVIYIHTDYTHQDAYCMQSRQSS